MKKLNLLYLLLILFATSSVSGQMRRQRPIISPEIKADNSITFRLMAPEAKTVKLTGNWMSGAASQVELMKNDSGTVPGHHQSTAHGDVHLHARC